MIAGYKIKEYRKEKGYTLKQLSERTGLSLSFISDIEHNRSNPSLDNLKKLADALNVSINSLITEDKNVDNTDLYTVFSTTPEAFAPLQKTVFKLINSIFNKYGKEFIYLMAEEIDLSKELITESASSINAFKLLSIAQQTQLFHSLFIVSEILDKENVDKIPNNNSSDTIPLSNDYTTELPKPMTLSLEEIELIEQHRKHNTTPDPLTCAEEHKVTPEDLMLLRKLKDLPQDKRDIVNAVIRVSENQTTATSSEVKISS